MAKLIIKVKPDSENVVWNLQPGGDKFRIVYEGAESLEVEFDAPDLTAAEERALDEHPGVISYRVIGDVHPDLQSLTGHEAGVVLWEDTGEMRILNWTQIAGLPRTFGATGDIGLGELLVGEPISPPENAMWLMLEHEREHDAAVVSGMPGDFAAWQVKTYNSETGIGDPHCIVVVSHNWN